MLIYSFVFFLAFIIYIEMGIYIFHLNPRSKLNIWFFIMCIVFAVWTMDNVLFHIIKDKDRILLYHKIFSFSWCIFPGIVLQLVLILTGRDKLLKKWWFYFILYLPGIFIAIEEINGVSIVKEFTPSNFGWKAVYNLKSYLYWMYEFYYVICLLASIIITWRWGQITVDPREKKQANVFNICSSITFILGFTAETILPILNIRFIPPMATVFMLLLMFGTWYAIAKYRFLAVTPSFAADEIVSNMMDIMLILNPDSRITSVNQRAS